MKKIIIITLVVAILVVGWFFLGNRGQNNTLTLGYVNYDPLIIVDETTGELSGISYDIAEAVADRLDQELVWSTESTWTDVLGGILAGDYDAVGIQMWPDVNREKVALFTKSPMQSPVYAYARVNDTRFTTGLASLNLAGLTVATVDQQIVGGIIDADYPNATMYTADDATYEMMFHEVADGEADIIFAEPAEANGFMERHPGLIMQIDEAPVRTFDNSFAFKKTDRKTVEAWNKAIDELIQDGTIKAILEKYGATDAYTF